MADRTQVHEERRGQYQPVHLHGLKNYSPHLATVDAHHQTFGQNLTKCLKRTVKI